MEYPYLTLCRTHFRIAFLKNVGVSFERRKVVDDSISELERIERSKMIAIKRAKRMIVDLALCNSFEFFGTLTIDSKRITGDIKEETTQIRVLEKVLDLLDNYKQNHSKDFAYILVPEFGEKKKRLHFHIICKGINKEDLFLNEYKRLDWSYFRYKLGFVNLTRIGNARNDKVRTAFYISKYISKDNVQIKTHRYFASKSLIYPLKCKIEEYAYTVYLKEWLEFNGIEPYCITKQGSCYSLNFAIFKDLCDTYGFELFNNGLLYPSAYEGTPLDISSPFS